MSKDKSNTLVRHINIMKNKERRKQSHLPNKTYWAVNAVLNSHHWAKMTGQQVLDELIKYNYKSQSFRRWEGGELGNYQPRLIAEAILTVNAHLVKCEAKQLSDARASIGALGQSLQRQLPTASSESKEQRGGDPVTVCEACMPEHPATMKVDVVIHDMTKEEVDLCRQELWGNKPDPEIRAKMTGGRVTAANLYQVGGHHYKYMPIQHWDYVNANCIPYMEAQIIKYVSRWRSKNGLQDLLKARHFLQKLIEDTECTAATSVKLSESVCESPAQPVAQTETGTTFQP